MTGVMIVDAGRLHETPMAFQQYVKEFFAWQPVLGKEAYVASTVLSFHWPVSGRGKGTAPCHSVDLMRFKEGLPENQNLNEWISEANGLYLWRFYDHEPRD